LREELEDLDQSLSEAAGFTEDEIESLTGEEEIEPRETEPENIDTSCKCPRCGHRFELSDS
jgi:rubredoxin